MKKLNLILIKILFLFILSVSPYFIANSNEYIIGLHEVIDGDSIKINNTNIRLSGIDAPEKKQKCFKKKQLYNCGFISLKALKNYISKNLVSCSYSKKDRYGRILGTCYLYNNQVESLSLNSYMVNTGNAVAYRRYSKKYIVDEQFAKQNKLGMWQGKFIRPEEWRKKNK